MSRRRSGYSGISKLRKTINRMEPTIKGNVQQAVVDVAETIMWTAIELAPVEYGDLRASIDYKLSSDKMTSVVGPGAKALEFMRSKKASIFSRRYDIKISPSRKHELMQALKGYWLEFGTKTITPRPFMQPAWDTNSAWSRHRVRIAIKNALEEAAR